MVEKQPNPGEISGLNRELNAAQRRAVTHPAEPLIVLAGPGTGKTRVITHRIAHQVLELGIEPESIVAVTFTIKAAQELRRRLRELVGSAKADRINASTFHALGMRLIQRFGDTLVMPPVPAWAIGAGIKIGDLSAVITRYGASRQGGPGPSLSRAGLVDSAQKKRLLSVIIRSAGLFKDSLALGYDDAAATAARAIGALSELAILPEDCERFAAHWASCLDQGRSPGDKELDAQGLAAHRVELARFEDITRAYTLYDLALRRAGLVSFADLITLPIRLLRQSPSRAAAIVRHEWRHFVVDEFQDVNAAQIELLRQLAPPSGAPDLCAVGDDDQAIYSFRGSDQRAFARFASIWRMPNGQDPVRIDLTDNYRSAPAIVGMTNRIIARAASRFSPDKVVRSAGAEDQACAARIAQGTVGVLLDSNAQAATAIASIVRTLGSEDAKHRPAKPDDSPTLAVVARSNTEVERIVTGLRLEGISVRTSHTPTPLDDPGVQDVLAWVRLIINPRSTLDARRLLTRPPWSCSLALVGDHERRFRDARKQAAAVDPDAPRAAQRSEPLDHFLRFLAESEGVEASLRSPARRLATMLDELSQFAATHNAYTVIRRIIAVSGIAHADLLSAGERTGRVAALVALVRFADQLQPRLDAPGDLRAFLAYYDDLDAHDQGMISFAGADERLDVDETDLGGSELKELDAPRQPGWVVQVLTAHKAKGLEFDAVFVPQIGATRGCYGSSVDDGRDAARIPEDILGFAHPEFADSEGPDDRADEERRVFYVACTRARRRLILLSKRLKGKSKSTHYFQELESDASLRAGFEVVGVNDVYQQAARAGVSRGGASLGRAGGGGGGEEQAELDEAFDDQFVRARREVRLLAAEAIEAADTPGLTKEQLDGTIDLLRDAAVRMGVIAHAASDSPDPPEWLIAAASNREGAANLARELTDRTAHARGGGVRGLLTPPPKGPLHLSYSQLDAYHRCPRCYYLRYILRLPEAEHDAEVVGSVVHKAIERFTLAALGREAAIADGLFAEPHAPASSRLLAADVQTLIRYGREALIDAGVNPSDPDDDQGMRVELLLRSYFEQFFNPDHHTLEVERAASFAFPAAGLVHTINVKIDRIDQYALPDGAAGFRVIDYKTGKDWKRLTQPAPDDLQLGCYALALESIYGDGDASSPASALRGSAEYWLLAGRQRGVLPLEKIRLDKVRTKISGAIDGMLAGKFEPDKRCERDCRLFEPN